MFARKFGFAEFESNTYRRVFMDKGFLKPKKVKVGLDDAIYYLLVNILLAFILVIVAYPLIYIVSASFSSPRRLRRDG